MHTFLSRWHAAADPHADPLASLHADLHTVPEPAESTQRITEGLGLAAYKHGGKA